MAHRYLSIVENAYRATVEEQDDTCLWFTHAMAKLGQAQVAVVLRGNAVNYAVKGQSATGLTFGTQKLQVPPDLPREVKDLLDAKVSVYIVSEDATDRGINATDLIPGVEPVARNGLAKLVDGFDRVFHW